jgi:hypothetical protein
MKRRERKACHERSKIHRNIIREIVLGDSADVHIDDR